MNDTRRDTPVLRIAVISGGTSEEREISIQSGREVSAGLREAGHAVTELLLEDRIDPHLDTLRADADVVFIALHGSYGEDGTVQEALELAGIRYTGSGPAAFRTGMSKAATKILCEAHGIRTPKYRLIGRESVARADDHLSAAGLRLPVVVKPDASGSSIGVEIVRERNRLVPALEAALAHGDSAMVEEYIRGRELTVGVLGSDVLPVVELEPKSEFFDFDAKYTDGNAEAICPARLDACIAGQVQDAAVAAFEAIGARDFGRVDVLLDGTGRHWVLEVNTIPGFTSHSLLPMAAREAGLPFAEVVSRIAYMAHSRRTRN